MLTYIMLDVDLYNIHFSTDIKNALECDRTIVKGDDR